MIERVWHDANVKASINHMSTLTKSLMCLTWHPCKDNCQSYMYNQKWHVWHDANVKTNVNCICFGQMRHVWHDATVKANTKSTNHICLINIYVLKEIHIPCHPTHIISTNCILISNDMEKLGVTLLHNFWHPTNLNCCKIQGTGNFYSLNQIN
jgi:hypothetical protein